METRKYILSIIIPVYNLKEYILKCLDSIVVQINDEVEVILINDGSTDGSGSICESFANKHSNISVYHQINSGVSNARNYGLSKSKSEYILFVDGDDLVANDAICQILHKAKTTKADIIAGSLIKIFDDNYLPEKYTNPNIINLVESKKGQSAFLELIKSSFFSPSMGTNIIKRNMFYDNNIFFNNKLLNNEDIDCALNLYMVANSIVVLEKSHYYYRQLRMNYVTKRASPIMIDSSIMFIELWLNRMDSIKQGSYILPWIRDYIYYQYSIMLGLIYLCPRESRKRLLNLAIGLNIPRSKGLSKKTRLLNIINFLLPINFVGRLSALYIRNKDMVAKNA